MKQLVITLREAQATEDETAEDEFGLPVQKVVPLRVRMVPATMATASYISDLLEKANSREYRYANPNSDLSETKLVVHSSIGKLTIEMNKVAGSVDAVYELKEDGKWKELKQVSRSIESKIDWLKTLDMEEFQRLELAMIELNPIWSQVG